jgi:hypothetical protein
MVSAVRPGPASSPPERVTGVAGINEHDVDAGDVGLGIRAATCTRILAFGRVGARGGLISLALVALTLLALRALLKQRRGAISGLLKN